MGYSYQGMKKMQWDEVQERHTSGKLEGCFKLYDDETEAQIEDNYNFSDIEAHHDNGGEFGYEEDMERED